MMVDVQPALGIDLGTTNSVAAVIYENKISVVSDSEGRAIHASALSFRPDGRLTVGNRARTESPTNTLLLSLKRLLGLRLDKTTLGKCQANFPFTIVPGPNKEPYVLVNDRKYAIPELCGMVIRHLKDMAEQSLQIELKTVVITVPAHFTDNQRQMTRLAAQLAGLTTLRIINEPTAAALGYGFGRNEQKRIAVFDLGGGTFDVTILELDGHIIEVLATGGDGNLGGDDFDRLLIEMVQERLETVSDLSMSQLMAIQSAKHELTVKSTATLPTMAFNGTLEALSISRSEQDLRCQPLVDRALSVCAEVLEAVGIDRTSLDHVILVGGATRMPLVQREVARFFKTPPITDVNPDTVVAIGAATQAYALLAAGISEPEALPLLIDVLPQSLGVGSVGNTVERLLEKNSVVPLRAEKTFVTAFENQRDVIIKVYQGESHKAVDNTLLGELHLTDLPPAPAGEIHIDVIFEIDVNGCLRVQIADHLSGIRQEAKLYISAGYDTETINTMRQSVGLLKL